MKQAVDLVAERLDAHGVAPVLTRTAFAALVDNALTHGGGRAVAAPGLPWLTRLLVTRCPDGRLLFMAGDGRLTFHRGVWACS